MIVIKRNGAEEELNFSKIKKVITFACENVEGVNPLELEQQLIPQLKHNITTKQIQKTLIQMAVEKTSVEQPNWQFVASKLFVYDLYKEASLNRGYKKSFGYGNFYNLIKDLTEKGLYGDYILKNYTKSEIDELGKYIKPERDYLFNYIGVKHIADRYAIKDFNGSVLELPQEVFMGVAMHLAMKEKDKLGWAKRMYDVISQLKLTVATPTLSNARKPHHQLSSCFIDTVGDDLRQIYDTNTAFAQVSKHGGGMGIYIGKVRAKGSDIRGYKNTSNGVVPWIKSYNDTAVACDQLGVRSGAVAIYLDIWHRDIFDFLNLRTNNGDDRMKAHDIFPGVCIPDLFMKQVKARGEWNLFCPHEVRKIMGFSLEDCYDETTEGGTFTERYNACVNNPILPRKTVPAIDIMKAIMKSSFETGTPFVFYRDIVNRANPNKHAGMIYSSNLCTEIMQNMSATEVVQETIKNENGEEYIVVKSKPGDFVVCNLSSLNLGRIENDEELEYVTTTAMRMMDNVIDLNYYPVPQAKITNQKYRAVGLGSSGYHQMLAQNKIQWESEEHLEFADKIYEKINFFTIKASMQNAKEKGAYKMFKGSEWESGEYFVRRGYFDENRKNVFSVEQWKELAEDVKKYGVRNAWMFAIAPTGSTSVIAGSTAGIDPVFAKYFVEEKKNAVIPQTAPNLNPETFWYYKESHKIDQIWSIKAAGRRQRHIDQSQSFNLYITPNISAPEFLNLYIQAWENGLKTIYYVRNQSLEVEDCVSCSS